MTAICYDQPKLINMVTDKKQRLISVHAVPLRNCTVRYIQHVLPHSQIVLSVTVKGLDL